MSTFLLDGKQAAAHTLDTLKTKLENRIAAGQSKPGLAVILVGTDAASQVYVNLKKKTCEQIGFNTFSHHLPQDTPESTLIELIHTLNDAPEVHGILVQLPLPQHIDETKIIELILPEKDVDGFHPYNLGKLAQGSPTLRPCTPYGIMKLLAYYNIDVAGKNAVVIGQSNIVGRPMALELLNARATVTICHRATQSIEAHVKQAELVIVATGVQDVIPATAFHKAQIVIDVGIHRLSDGSLRGDIEFNQIKDKVGWITPVPGGVGPMTICTLLENTLAAAKLQEA